jgi:nucleotide-binding universal stress UspA family protein
MPEKLLVPLDGSKLSEGVLPYVEELASKTGYEVILINVRSPAEDPYHPDLQEYLESIADRIQSDIQTNLKKSSYKRRKIRTEIVGSGTIVTNSAKGILDYADNENIAMIVMATHGRTGISLWTLGSVAEKIVQVSKHPVLLIRVNNDLKKDTIHKILVPLDGSRECEFVLAYTGNLAFKLKAKVTLLHIISQPYYSYASADGLVDVTYSINKLNKKKEDAKKYLEEKRKVLEQKNIMTAIQVRSGQVDSEIVNLAEKNNFDLVVMSTQGGPGFHNYRHGSVADKVLHESNIPLLLVRKKMPGKRSNKK